MANGPMGIPSLLSPYLSFRESSLILVTYVLGATANWLLLRQLSAALYQDEGKPQQGVILLSFLRDFTFWKEGARKLGLDLSRFAAQNRFVFVDGLTELFARSDAGKPGVQGDHVILRDAKLQSIEAAILDLIQRMNAFTGRTILLVDGLDFLMAATEETVAGVGDTVMALRESAYSLVVTASADNPLIHNPTTPLEINHLALVAGLAYQTEMVMGLRMLDTGTAKDVSGVLRISRGPEAAEDLEEKELLYFVGGDGVVKVFERGASI